MSKDSVNILKILKITDVALACLKEEYIKMNEEYQFGKLEINFRIDFQLKN